MLRTIRIKDTDTAIERGWHVVLVARAPGSLKRLIDDGRLEHIPDLAPSPELLRKVNEFKNQNSWNEMIFQKEFVPAFLEETCSDEFRAALNDLYVRLMKGENIALTCFCKDSEMCHRSIVVGLLQAAGVKTVGPDYSVYWLQRQLMIRQQKKEP